MEGVKTPKQVAQEEVYKRIVTFEAAKEKYKNWITSSLGAGFDDQTLSFWNEVLVEIDALTPPLPEEKP